MLTVFILGERKLLSLFNAYSVFYMARLAPRRTLVDAVHPECKTYLAGLEELRQVPFFRAHRPPIATSHGYITDPISVCPPSQPCKAFLISLLPAFLCFTADGEALLPLGSISFVLLIFAAIG